MTTRTFHLTILEREARRIKQKHVSTINDIMRKHFRNQSPPGTVVWQEFSTNCPSHFNYLLELYALGCYLARPRYSARLERAFLDSPDVSYARRTVALFKQLSTVDIDVFDSYCRHHHKDVSQTFVRIHERMQRFDKFDKGEREPLPASPAGVCYALTLSGTDYFLGHILVPADKAMPEKDIKVAVMTKESVSHTPRVTAVVLCSLRYIPNCHRLYRQFIILDTRDQGLYDFTILINRVTRSFEDIKGILVADQNIRYVITPAP